MQNKQSNKKLSGFYIALCCCVLTLGAAGYVSEQINVRKANNLVQNVEVPTSAPKERLSVSIIPIPTPAEVSVFNEETPLEILPTVAPLSDSGDSSDNTDDVLEENETEDFTEDNPDVAEASVSINAEEDFMIPVNGEIIKSYSSAPEFDSLMNDWRTHNGEDIKAQEGEEVKCAANGEIKAIDETVRGKEITISHSGGYETIYAQINPKEGLLSGSNVRGGDVIGTVAASKGESETETHLHFEVKKNGVYVDPSSFLN